MRRSGNGEKPHVGGAQGRAVCKELKWQEVGLGMEEGRIPCCRAPSATIRISDLALGSRKPLEAFPQQVIWSHQYHEARWGWWGEWTRLRKSRIRSPGLKCLMGTHEVMQMSNSERRGLWQRELHAFLEETATTWHWQVAPCKNELSQVGLSCFYW